ncbi:MAG: secondary thiamine-phosphate synthase enzyme YjbQ [Actinomycetota bacterium]
MRTEVFDVDASARRFIDLTTMIDDWLEDEDGLVNIFVPHATAGLAVIETGSGTESDLHEAIDRLLPREDIYTHAHGSKGHGADHVLPAFLSPSLTIPVTEGKMTLGTWQSVVFVDLNVDNPHRQIRLSLLG